MTKAVNKMVTIAKFHDKMEAEVCRSKLEASEIFCHIKMEAYQSMLPGQLPWDIELQVPAESVQAAKEILALATSEPEVSNTSSNSDDKKPSQKTKKIKPCPRCESTKVQDSSLIRLMTVIGSALLGLVIPLNKRTCEKCGHKF